MSNPGLSLFSSRTSHARLSTVRCFGVLVERKSLGLSMHWLLLPREGVGHGLIRQRMAVRVHQTELMRPLMREIWQGAGVDPKARLPHAGAEGPVVRWILVPNDERHEEGLEVALYRWQAFAHLLQNDAGNGDEACPHELGGQQLLLADLEYAFRFPRTPKGRPCAKCAFGIDAAHHRHTLQCALSNEGKVSLRPGVIAVHHE